MLFQFSESSFFVPHVGKITKNILKILTRARSEILSGLAVLLLAGNAFAAVCADERYGVNLDLANPKGTPATSELNASGARWVRVEFKSPGSLDSAIADYRSRLSSVRSGGAKVLLIVGYAMHAGKPASNVGDQAKWNQYFDGFYPKLQKVIPALDSSVDAWQIWNEPDISHPGGYDPGVPADTFGRALVKAAKIIKKSSSRPIISGGMGAGLFAYFDKMVRTAGSDWSLIDGAGLHPYGQRAPAQWPSASWGYGAMKDLFDVYLRIGKYKPLWITEIGANNLSADLQAQYLENVYRLAESYGSLVPRVLWFCWSDGMVPPFGLRDGSDRAKPAYERFKSLAKQAIGKACE